jgi:purine-nucleoside phosphorylase
MLEEVICYNQVRGMLGFTGRYADKRVSVMGSGMGQPSLSIYINELVSEYGVKTLIRVGTCGAFQPYLKVGDIVLPMTSSTDSSMNRLRFQGMDYAPAASFHLLLKAYEAARARGASVYVVGELRRTRVRDGDQRPLHAGGKVQGGRALRVDCQRQPGDR